MESQEFQPPATSRFSTRPGQAGLAMEDDEKRALRERVEELEAHDVDRLEADLRSLSGIFNQRLQALVTEDASDETRGARPQARPNHSNSPFVAEVCLSD